MRNFTIWLICLFIITSIGTANAQTKVITGTVTSAEDGLPIPGVTVVVPGTTVGTTTDLDGKYTISVKDSYTHLRYQYVGMITKDIAIGASTQINVVLDPDIVLMDEVVVTAMGITREKKALGYSVTEVGGDDIAKASNVSVMNSLAGKVAGVKINSSTGAAGGSTFVEIRGSTSITGNNQPLYVIDGVPINSGGGVGNIAGVALSDRTIDINPDDIQTMSVLKGASASALYGMRAANGAIIITTKKGKERKGLNVNFSSAVTLEKISQTLELQDKYAQGSIEWGHSIFQPDRNGSSHSVSWGALIDTLRYTTDPTYKGNGSATMEDFIKYWDPNGRIVGMSDPRASDKKVVPYDRYAFFQTGVTTNNAINVSGGNDITTFYASLSNSKTEGVVPNNIFERTTVKLSGSTKLSDKLMMSTSMNYVNSAGDRIQQGSNTSGIMLGLLRTPATFDNSYGYRFPDTYRSGRQRTYRNGGGYDNPYWIANEILFTDENNRLFGNITVDWDINNWMKLTSRTGLDVNSYKFRNNFSPYSAAAPAGQTQVGMNLSKDFNQDIFLNMKRNLTENLELNAIVGYNMYQRQFEGVTATANDVIIRDFYDLSNTTDASIAEAENLFRTSAWYADLSFAYKNMLYANFTGRYESSTTLPEDANTLFYPSASLGFVFSEFPAFKDLTWLSFAKARISYARMAQVPNPYRTDTYFGQAGPGDGWTNGLVFPFNGANGYTLSNSLGNTTLKPESSNEFEVGLAFNLFQNRLSFDVAYFSRVNEELLLNVPTAASTGYTSRYMNAGAMETKGWEILVTANIVKTKVFRWDLTLNWSNPNSIVTKLAEGVPNVGLGGFTEPQVRAIVGQQYRSIFGIGWLRDDAGNLIINDDPSNGSKVGYPVRDPNTKFLGSVQSDWNMGITNDLTYKGFSLSFLIDIKSGGQMWNGTRGALDYFGTSYSTANRDEDYVWKGVLGHLNADGTVTSTGTANTMVVKLDEDWRWWSGNSIGSGFTGPTEPYVEDANWVRLRDLTFSYNFSKVVSKIAWIRSLELYFTGHNLWISTPYTGIDPETSLLGASNAQGFDYFNMPGTKSYTFGVKVGF